MSNNSASFSFPPPPPPPPKVKDDSHASRGGPHNFNSPRGRGRPYGNQRGTFNGGSGRGSGGGRGHGRYPGSRGPSQPHQNFSVQNSNTQKRNFGSAFGQNSRPQAPPAVPSFSAGLENLLPTKLAASAAAKNDAQSLKKSNMLGLTPAQADTSDSEDEGDEESRLAAAAKEGDIQFEYKGHTSTLRTPAEIAVWIAERRKRYPTQAKREAAQKEAAQRKKRYDEEKQARQEAIRKVREDRDERQKANKSVRSNGSKTIGKPLDKTSANEKEHAQFRADKLRRRLEKAKRDLAAAAAAASGNPVDGLEEGSAVDPDESILDSSTLHDSDATSSSGSESDSDAAPEVTSSKVEQPSIRRASHTKQPSSQQVCSYFAKNGQCKFGRRCRYAHAPQEAAPRGPEPARREPVLLRKGLWQVMVDKEQDEEQKRVLRAIIALGEAGLLEEPDS